MFFTNLLSFLPDLPLSEHVYTISGDITLCIQLYQVHSKFTDLALNLKKRTVRHFFYL